MALKNFKTRNGVDIDTYTTPVSVVQATIKTNSITTVDTIPMASFVSAEYLITITQGSKTRTSSLIMQTDGTSVDMTEYGIFETGGTISGIVVSATTSSTNAVLQITITDAATTIARVKISKTLNVAYTASVPDAPTIGTATGGVESASITFTAPYDNGGATITSYSATSTPGSITGTASSSPVTVSGLTGGTAYTFVIAAINSAGVSATSAASNSVTPTVAPVQAAYFAGGDNCGGCYVTTLDKLSFSNEARTVVSGGLSSQRVQLSSMANSGTAGYVGGGFNTSTVNTVEKFNFIDDSRSIVSGGLSGVRKQLGAMANSGTAGYFGGGSSSGPGLGGNAQTNIDKFAFSNDSRSALATALSTNAEYVQSLANSGTAGYFFIGANSTLSTVNKYAFSNDSRTAFSTGLTLNTQENSGLANSGTAGYLAGASTTVRKMLFSNETFSSVASGLPSARYSPGAAAKSGTAGYFAGGSNAGLLNSITKIIFSNDTNGSVSATLSQARTRPSGFANSGTL